MTGSKINLGAKCYPVGRVVARVPLLKNSRQVVRELVPERDEETYSEDCCSGWNKAWKRKVRRPPEILHPQRGARLNWHLLDRRQSVRRAGSPCRSFLGVSRMLHWGFARRGLSMCLRCGRFSSSRVFYVSPAVPLGSVNGVGRAKEWRIEGFRLGVVVWSV